jgi:tyrosyl-tRNA synthetase
MTFTQLLIHTKVLSSKSEARRLIESGGVYVSNKRISEPHHLSSHLLGDKFLVIRIGKKDFKIIEVV